MVDGTASRSNSGPNADPSAPLRRGVTQAADPRLAAQELYDSLYQPGLALVLLFCSPQYDLAGLAAALTRRFGDTLVVGCTTAGEITPLGYRTGTVTGIGFPASDFVVTAERLDGLDGFTIADGAAVVARLATRHENARPLPGGSGPARSFAFLLVDGLSEREEMVVSALHSALGDVPLFGGSAGDDLRFRETLILHQGRFHPNAAILLLFTTTRPFSVFRTEHFVSSGRKMVVTEADPLRRVVSAINAEPAAQEYARMVGLQDEPLTPMIFAAHPVVVRVGGEYYVRAIQKVNDDDSLTFFCAIDEGIVLTAAQGVDLVENLEALMARLTREVGPPDLIIGCDCILRALEMEQRQIKHSVSALLARHNTVGFATYGEQINAMHVNQTFTGVAIGAPRQPG